MKQNLTKKDVENIFDSLNIKEVRNFDLPNQLHSGNDEEISLEFSSSSN